MERIVPEIDEIVKFYSPEHIVEPAREQALSVIINSESLASFLFIDISVEMPSDS